ncbi:MAG: EamA family transporter [Alphaproteobacteria bacterium]|nr:EamA family transporter [Alphaproteobacteria bacterium]
MLGALLSLASAASFALNAASVRRGVITSTVFQALAFTVPIGVPLFLLAAAVSGQLPVILAFEGVDLLWLSLAGIFHFVWGRYCGTRAIKAMGGNLAGPVQQSNLLMSLTLAVVWLGETLTPMSVLGIALVFIGPAIMIAGQRRRAPARRVGAGDKAAATETPGGGDGGARPGFRPNYLEGTLFAVLTATGYGLSPIFVRLALEDAGPGVAIAAGAVSYIAATAFFALLLVPPGKLAHVLAVDRKAASWFTVSAVFVCIAQMLRYLALSLAPVTIIAPIQRTSMVFRVIFTTILNRDYEVMNAWVVIGIAISFAGAMALAVSIDMVAEVVALPPGLAQWRWP